MNGIQFIKGFPHKNVSLQYMACTYISQVFNIHMYAHNINTSMHTFVHTYVCTTNNLTIKAFEIRDSAALLKMFNNL